MTLSNLYQNNFDRSLWQLTSKPNNLYKLTNLRTNKSVEFKADLIGFCQVPGNSNRFLINEFVNMNLRKISEIVVYDSMFTSLFELFYRNCVQIDDFSIIVDHSERVAI